ncbi:DUF1659 domain-containing protein [Pelosinus baikalensis]|uniref:DUF1659 domain-containing protein n=1 Tax=Pelosinus baikalensis TaxID=2892015 RepID=A0ABS8HLZ4_9FIRM|nr:DUF1659 domain-containing protein [Pelosinus baikalensis]MCC5464065.1 DUF1659 domain-containing protein [Pelosinus baikalensis]
MAVNKVPQTSKVVITIENGVNAKGQPVQRQRSYKNVKVSAADADVYAVAQAIANLQTHVVVGISRQDEGNLVNA